MIARKPGKYIEHYSIPPAGTHNTVPPFTSSIVRGPECTVDAVRMVGDFTETSAYIYPLNP